ncbi:uncharacterized mitochondrial protein AtMg00860-like [Aristolochia californica]|uniref:uncharacterized mitochondrial protein AtMg00860-like n=1 Tax=Aristolochia californica TaxID=171875 RepID=UPI0035DF1C52
MNTSAFRGFLGLAKYYRKFIINYGPITAPLTNILMKNSFIWNDQATQSFSDLKLSLASAPVLQLPNFEDLFELIAGSTTHKLPVYEHELIGSAKAIQHWHPSLWGCTFLIRTDHYNLKYLLEQ